MIGSQPDRLAQEIGEWAGDATHRDGAEPIAVGYMQATACSTAEAMRPLQHRIEDRGEVAGRAVDNLQYLGGRGLLRQRFVALGGALGELLFEPDDLLLEIGDVSVAEPCGCSLDLL